MHKEHRDEVYSLRSLLFNLIGNPIKLCVLSVYSVSSAPAGRQGLNRRKSKTLRSLRCPLRSLRFPLRLNFVGNPNSQLSTLNFPLFKAFSHSPFSILNYPFSTLPYMTYHTLTHILPSTERHPIQKTLFLSKQFIYLYG